MCTINDFLAYIIVSGWSTYVKLACLYCMKNNKAFTLTNGSISSFFTTTSSSYQQITILERTERICLLAELKGMLHCYFFQVKNYMTWYRSTVTLCLVFNVVSRSFLVLVLSIIE